MLYKIGRFLQLVGMIVLPVAIAGQVAEKLTLKTFYILSAAGVVIFFIGWLLQQAGNPRD